MTDVPATQIDHLRGLTRKAGQAQRPGCGLAGILGGLLLIMGYLWTYDAPDNNTSVNLLRAAGLGGLWAVSLPLFRQFYARDGRVKGRPTPKESRQWRWSVVYVALVIALFWGVVAYQTRVLGWPGNTERLFLAPALVVAVSGLTFLTRHHAAGFVLIGLSLLSQPRSQLFLDAYHRYFTWPILLSAAFLILFGLYEHAPSLKTRRRLAAPHHE